MSEQEIIKALEDLKIGDKEIQQFMEYYHIGDLEKQKTILATHRHKILNELHLEQNKLYCLDYLLKQLEKVKNKFRRKNYDFR